MSEETLDLEPSEEQMRHHVNETVEQNRRDGNRQRANMLEDAKEAWERDELSKKALHVLVLGIGIESNEEAYEWLLDYQDSMTNDPHR